MDQQSEHALLVGDREEITKTKGWCFVRRRPARLGAAAAVLALALLALVLILRGHLVSESNTDDGALVLGLDGVIDVAKGKNIDTGKAVGAKDVKQPATMSPSMSRSPSISLSTSPSTSPIDECAVVRSCVAPAPALNCSRTRCFMATRNCVSNSNCCSNICTSGVCVCVANGAACTADEQCCLGACKSNLCVDGGFEANACTTDRDCGLRVCVGGKCIQSNSVSAGIARCPTGKYAISGGGACYDNDEVVVSISYGDDAWNFVCHETNEQGLVEVTCC
eukprot:gb/GEZN01007468.1/.p1 GENE.gb/GEZN01007468.1/~~gb/GEZN01007468.1/.p1  ORF type:complete len:279 (-),score=3.84 gb/GEZN01007468.1/:664-1500(-)